MAVGGRKLPFYKVTPGAWIMTNKTLSSVPTLVAGALFKLQNISWFAGDTENPPLLPNNPVRLRAIAGLSEEEWAAHESLIMECLTKDEKTGLLYVNDLFDQWKSIREVSEARAAAGAKGGTAKAAKREKATVVTASSDLPAEVPEVDKVWQQIRAIYPTRSGGQGWRDAEHHYRNHVRKGVAPGEILDGVVRYKAFMTAKGSVGTEFVKQAATFLGRGEWWKEEYTISPNGNGGKPSVARKQFQDLEGLRNE